MSLTIEDVFAPFSVSEFKQSYLDRKVLYVPGHPTKFAELFSWDHLDSLLRYQRRGGMIVNLVLEGNEIPRTEYYQGYDRRLRWKRNHTRLAVPALHAYLQRGAVLHVAALHEVCAPLAELNEQLERAFLCHSGAVAFASWRTKNGFPLHYSVDGVLVLQITGRKKWNVYQPSEQSLYPVYQEDGAYQQAVQKMDKQADRGEPLRPEYAQELADIKSRVAWSGILNQGDLLYVPRGFFHKVFPLPGPAIHVSCTFAPLSGVDLMEHLAEELSGSVAFRKSLPRFASQEDRQRHMRELREQVLAVWDDGFLDRFFQTYDEMSTPLPRFNMRWSGTEEVLPVDRDTVLRWTPVRPVPLQLDDERDELEFRALGETARYSGNATTTRGILEFLMTERAVSMGAVLDRFEGEDTPRDDIVGFLRQLVLDGLVSVQETGS